MVSPVSPGPEMKVAVHYRGPDVDRGRMSAIDLGPAIFGFGKMVSETSRILYGDESRVRAEVRADFEHASFGIEFYTVGVTGDLLPVDISQVAEVVKILGFGVTIGAAGVKGLIWIIRRLRGRKIQRADREGDRVTIHAEGSDSPSFTITYNEYRVVMDPEIRKGLRALIQPLEREGIDELEVAAENLPAERITKQELPVFEAPLSEEEVSTDTHTTVLEVISPVFREGNKWKFAEGAGTFWAEVADDDFLERVSRHRVMFGQGDALRVIIEVRVTRRGGQLEYDRKIIRVLEHIPAEGGGGEDQIDFSELTPS